MTPEELFEEHRDFGEKVLSFMYGHNNLQSIAAKYRVEIEDLIQIANIGLWKACQIYDKTKSSFKKFAMMIIRQEIIRELKKLSFDSIKKSEFRNESNIISFVSMDKKTESHESEYSSFHEIITTVENNLDYDDLAYVSNIFDDMNEKERELVELRLQGKTLRELGVMYGVSRQAIEQRLRAIGRRLKKKGVIE